MAVTISKDGGGTTVTPEYADLDEVYGRGPEDKQPAISKDSNVAFSIGAPYADPSAFDGEDIVIETGVRTLKVTGDGASGATSDTGLATTGGSGSGLTVDLTAAGGVVTAAAPNAMGKGYRLGDVITVSALTAGTGEAVTLEVTLTT